MKLFNYLCMGMVSLMLSVGFISCSDDDEPSGGSGGSGSSNANTPLELRLRYMNDGFIESLYFYNEDGKIEGESRKMEGKPIGANHWEWAGNSVTLEQMYDSWTETIENGRIIKRLYTNDFNKIKYQRTDHYSYNSDGRLIKIEGKVPESECRTDLTWVGNRLVKIEGYNKDKDFEQKTTITFTYSGRKAKGAYAAVPSFSLSTIALCHPELVGLVTDEMPDAMTLTETCTYNYGESVVGEGDCISKRETEWHVTLTPKIRKDGYLDEWEEAGPFEEKIVYNYKDLNEDGTISANERNVEEVEKENKKNKVDLSWQDRHASNPHT